MCEGLKKAIKKEKEYKIFLTPIKSSLFEQKNANRPL
jgi:hypothetical protein